MKEKTGRHVKSNYGSPCLFVLKFLSISQGETFQFKKTKLDLDLQDSSLRSKAGRGLGESRWT